jgi:hypothetical protein
MLTVTNQNIVHGKDFHMPIEDFGDFKLVRKKPVIVHAMEMHQHFAAQDLKGNITQGEPGDYLMKGLNGELYACPRDVFQKSYESAE